MDYNRAPSTYGMKDAHEGFREDFWQGPNSECAINAQFRILQDFGYKGTVEDLKKEAIEHGWFTEGPNGGTSITDVGKLLELHGVPCTTYFEANRYNLLNELAHGKRVIVTVDSSELWHNNTLAERSWQKLRDLLPTGADHALVVSGLRASSSDPNDVEIVLTDSGDGSRTISYPISQFEDAWRDGHCQMVVTNEVPPEEYRMGAMTNFDYEKGHVVAIGGVPFEEWQRMHADELNDGRRAIAISDGCLACDAPEDDPAAQTGDGPVAESDDPALAEPLLEDLDDDPADGPDADAVAEDGEGDAPDGGLSPADASHGDL